jgi:predicted phage-related endonuclease
MFPPTGAAAGLSPETRKHGVAISEEQRVLRAARLGSSDGRRLMAGQWREVWEEKTGRREPPDLGQVPCVQIGVVTEPLHARFYTHRTGIPCRPAEGTLVHPEFHFIVAHPDFLTWRRLEDMGGPSDTLLEAKFHAGTKSDGELAQQYYWQVQHQLLVSGLSCAVLSVLRPTSYSLLPVERSARDIAALLDTLHAFWWYVENDVEPADAAPAPAPAVEGGRVLDMSRHNEFAAWGGVVAEHHEEVRLYREAEAALKALMPEDAQVAFLPEAGAGVVLSRRKDGSCALRLGDLPKRYRARAEAWAPPVGHWEDEVPDDWEALPR